MVFKSKNMIIQNKITKYTRYLSFYVVKKKTGIVKSRLK